MELLLFFISLLILRLKHGIIPEEDMGEVPE